MTVHVLKGKSAIVTGGSRGIGRAVSERLATQGASLVISYVRDAESANQVVDTIEKMGGKAVSVQANMSKIDEIEKMVDVCFEHFGTFDILVNNAGMVNYKKIEEFTEEEFDEIFQVNVKGLFFACQQAARRMNDGGSIVNIGSSVTKVMMPTYGAYGATKGAVEQITKVLAKEVGHRQIRVNTLSPGPVDTELFRAGKSQEQIAFLASMAAFNRIGTPEDIASIVELLVSDGAGWITGQNILANGGFIG